MNESSLEKFPNSATQLILFVFLKNIFEEDNLKSDITSFYYIRTKSFDKFIASSLSNRMECQLFDSISLSTSCQIPSSLNSVPPRNVFRLWPSTLHHSTSFLFHSCELGANCQNCSIWFNHGGCLASLLEKKIRNGFSQK